MRKITSVAIDDVVYSYYREAGRGGRYVIVNGDIKLDEGTLDQIKEQIDSYEWLEPPRIGLEPDTSWYNPDSYYLSAYGSYYAGEDLASKIKRDAEIEKERRAAARKQVEDKERAELARLEKKYRGE